MGFSAAGEVAALMETRFDAGNANAAGPIDRAQSRPDFAVVVLSRYRPGTITVPKDGPDLSSLCR